MTDLYRSKVKGMVENMTNFKFCYFVDYEDGKLAHLETCESEIRRYFTWCSLAIL